MNIKEFGFVHNVYFWLKPDLSLEDKKSFEQGLESLRKIDTVGAFAWGKSITSPREVVEDSYHYAINVFLTDSDAHDIYQQHPVHKTFINKHKDKWTRVFVLDNTNEYL